METPGSKPKAVSIDAQIELMRDNTTQRWELGESRGRPAGEVADPSALG